MASSFHLTNSSIRHGGWVSDAHAQRIMRNGVIIPPHDFKHPSRWYYRVLKQIKYEIAVVTNGITST
jgi:hypothetical protein